MFLAMVSVGEVAINQVRISN